jgi:hypothetical protein
VYEFVDLRHLDWRYLKAGRWGDAFITSRNIWGSMPVPMQRAGLGAKSLAEGQAEKGTAPKPYLYI